MCMHGGAGCVCKFRGQWRPEEGVRTLGADLQVQKQKALGTPDHLSSPIVTFHILNPLVFISQCPFEF